jgi:hypothetical protein
MRKLSRQSSTSTALNDETAFVHYVVALVNNIFVPRTPFSTRNILFRCTVLGRAYARIHHVGHKYRCTGVYSPAHAGFTQNLRLQRSKNVSAINSII